MWSQLYGRRPLPTIICFSFFHPGEESYCCFFLTITLVGLGVAVLFSQRYFDGNKIHWPETEDFYQSPVVKYAWL